MNVRTVLPLATMTVTSMLAMDFYLPAVPSLQRGFAIDVVLAQATIAVFLLGLATSQLLWAEVMAWRGPRASVVVGLSLLVASSVVAAMAPTIEVLIGARLVQGVGAGAATVVAPSVVRATLSGTDAVRGIAAISMIEAIVPAVGPVLGAIVLAYADWRATFWILAAATLAAAPFAIRAAPRELPGLDRTVPSTYWSVISNRKFTRLALSHALGMGALLTFIASAPQLMSRSAFAALQIIGVAAFVIFASQAGRINKRIGTRGAVQSGAWIQVVLCAVMVAASYFGVRSFAAYAVFWFVFCGALAVRGPAAFSDALELPAAQLGRGSALMVLAILAAGAIGTQVVAPLLREGSPSGMFVALLLACASSVALVAPYPRDKS
jgi:DHA1 family bicyclomycin/chloramphenicol resistance-like MFS transporter